MRARLASRLAPATAFADLSADHGALVPLWFLAEAGWTGPTTVVGLPRHPTVEWCRACGLAIGQVVAALGSDLVALVASGDMSHRVLPGAPAGHHPRAVDFDRAMTDLVRRGALDRLASIDPEFRALAAEDAVDTTMIAAASTDDDVRGAEVLSYEHPFGVGYLVAVLFDPGSESR